MTNSPLNHEDHESCSCAQTCSQTLDEMEFERGIWSAAQNGEMERLIRLARRGVDAVDQGGYTALHYAARAGHMEICRQLLLLGAAINIRTRAGRATPLHRAASAGHTDVVKLLLQAGADVSLVDSDGQNSVHRAAAAGHVHVLRLLLEYNRNCLSVADNRGQLPLHLGEKSPSAKDLQFLQLLQ